MTLEKFAGSGVKFVAKARRAGLEETSLFLWGQQRVFCETYLRIAISLSSQNKKQGLLASDRGVERVQA